MSLKKKLLVSSGILFVLFLFFSQLVHRNHFTQFDFDMTVRLQDHISRRFDTWFSLLSTIGRVEVVSLLLLIMLLIYRKLKGIVVLLLFGLFHLFEIYGKTFVQHLPPPHFLLRTQQLVNFPQYYVSPQNSFPSGHAARALFVTVVLGVFAYKTKRITTTQKVLLYIVLGVYDMTMCISRVYLGEHWTTDVIGGSLLGASFGLLSCLFVL